MDYVPIQPGPRRGPYPMSLDLLGSWNDAALDEQDRTVELRRSIHADPELGLSLSRTVHVDQRFAWQRPLRSGDEVSATLTIEKVRTRGATAIITIAVQLATTAGEALCTATSTLMHTMAEAA